GHPQAVLVAHVGGGGDDPGVAFGLRRLGHHLHDALVVAQVDEAQAAEVAGDVGPAAQGDGLADQRFIDQAAEVGTHGNSGQWTAPARGKPDILPGWRIAGTMPASAPRAQPGMRPDGEAPAAGQAEPGPIEPEPCACRRARAPARRAWLPPFSAPRAWPAHRRACRRTAWRPRPRRPG